MAYFQGRHSFTFRGRRWLSYPPKKTNIAMKKHRFLNRKYIFMVDNLKLVMLVNSGVYLQGFPGKCRFSDELQQLHRIPAPLGVSGPSLNRWSSSGVHVRDLSYTPPKKESQNTWPVGKFPTIFEGFVAFPIWKRMDFLVDFSISP